jgi:hypothetical protein
VGAARKVYSSAARTKAASEHQLKIVLDRRVALEALLVNAIQKSPAARRQEWLRRVLIQGFRAECQAVRALMTGSPTPNIPRWQQAPGPTNGHGPAAHVETDARIDASPQDPGTKPLAQLRNTIG